MPYVNIKITEESVTSEQKARLIEGVTNLLKEVLGKKPAGGTRFRPKRLARHKQGGAGGGHKKKFKTRAQGARYI